MVEEYVGECILLNSLTVYTSLLFVEHWKMKKQNIENEVAFK